MNKSNVFRSSNFHMDEGDVLHIIIKDEVGDGVSFGLVGETSEEGGGDSEGGVLAPPIALAASDVTVSGFTANWGLTEGADGYYLRVATDSDMTPAIDGYNDLDVGNVNYYDVTGLTPGVVYYYYLIAYNEDKVSVVSNVISVFVESPSMLLDKDGNEYTTVLIGDQEWIVENYRTTTYADGTAIPNITTVAYSDWFLPSKDEIQAMYDELYLYGVGDMNAIDSYWTSSENDATTAIVLTPVDGLFINVSKDNASTARIACRTFVAGLGEYSLRDIGPAGGYIFIVSGTTYYEMSPGTGYGAGWSNVSALLLGTTGTAVGTGQANTNAIIGQAGHSTSAAKECDDLSIDSLSVWRNDTDGAYCWYDNNISNKTPYGALYNWYAVDNAHGLAYFEKDGVEQTGWRVATSTDYTNLVALLGGEAIAGGHLKEREIVHWLTPNLGALDTYGFSGIGGGIRSGVSGNFTEQQITCNLATQTSGVSYLLEAISTGFSEQTSYDASYGFSVRCVRTISTGTTYIEYTDGVDTFRKGVRSEALVVDKTLTATGFAGTEGVDWENIKSTAAIGSVIPDTSIITEDSDIIGTEDGGSLIQE